jgi:hypothetical protein
MIYGLSIWCIHGIVSVQKQLSWLSAFISYSQNEQFQISVHSKSVEVLRKGNGTINYYISGYYDSKICPYNSQNVSAHVFWEESYRN